MVGPPISRRASGAILTNSGMLTARLAAVELSTRIGGLSLPSWSRCVRDIWVWGDRFLEEKTSQRPLGEKLCQEFMRDVFERIRRGTPPAAGTMYSWLSGRIRRPLRHWTNTIHLPSGETFGKVLLMPFRDAPAIGSGVPPRPALNGIR